MNHGHSANTWLAVGGMVSLILHLVGGIALLEARHAAPGSGEALQRSALDQAQDPDRIELGVQDSTSVSINWLGFADPTEHRGELSETEQPALSMAPVGAPSEPTPPSQAQTPSPSAPSKRAPVSDTPSPSEALAAASPSTPDPGEPAPSLAITPQEADQSVQAGEGALKLNPWGVPPAPESVDGPPAGGSPQDGDAGESGKANNPEQAKPAPSGADDIPGLPSDRESVATALREATNLTQWGKPLARKGLEIKTVRPRWRTTTLLTRLPRNPVVMVSFGADGKVTRAEYVKYEGRRLSTGSRDVDEPLLDAVYKWRAKGKPLESLGKGETISFAIRVVLRR